jgi:hypothetical protein
MIIFVNNYDRIHSGGFVCSAVVYTFILNMTELLVLLYSIPVYQSMICSPLHYSDSIDQTASESILSVRAFMLLLFMVIRLMLSHIIVL